MIVPVPDELIMAFADGELEADLVPRLREAIRNDDAIRHKYEIFCTTRDVLRDAFNDILSEPVPDRLMRTIITGRLPRSN